VTSSRLLIVAALVAAALALGSAGADPGPEPGASAQAFAVKIVAPGRDAVSTQVVSAPPDASSLLDSFSSQGVAAGSIAAGASTQSGATAVGSASADVSNLVLFGGEITADGVSGRAKASAGPGGAAGDLAGAGVANLVVLGQKVDPKPNLKLPLADWGYLVVLGQGVDRSAPKGAEGFRGFVTALDVHLNVDHGGLPAGTEILVGYAEAAAMTAPAPPPEPTTTTTTTTTQTMPRGAQVGPPHHLTHPGKGAKSTKKKKKKPKVLKPLKVTPALAAGPYRFPVYGRVAFGDTFGAVRNDIASGWHHGVDIFGELGQPVLAISSGTIFSVGWNKIGGNRLWLRDRRGNQFYYAHLAAYASKTVNGAHVRAGDVIGFMGNSGDASTTPYHLHFEIHPVSFLYRKYDGAVDPETYLAKWRRVQEISFPTAAAWVPALHGRSQAPEPGAILLQVSDISQAAGLDPASVDRALARAPGP
jgi:murein DD-endopeptidase MepM/ murein hydrolase activator NlpD